MEGWKDGRMEGWMEGWKEWKDGRMEGWKDGRMEGWKDQPPCDHRALRASFFPAAHEGVKILTLPLLSGLILETLGLARRSQRGGAFDRAIRLKLVEVSRRGPQPNRPRPDFAGPTSRPTPRCFFTPGQGAPKRSDGGVVLVLVLEAR